MTMKLEGQSNLLLNHYFCRTLRFIKKNLSHTPEVGVWEIQIITLPQVQAKCITLIYHHDITYF